MCTLYANIFSSTYSLFMQPPITCILQLTVRLLNIPVGPTQTKIATRAISDAFHYSKRSYQSNHVIPSSSCSISVLRDVISASNLPQMERARRPHSPPSNFLSALFRANLICSVCYVPRATPSTTASFALQSVFARMQQCKHKSAGDVLRVVVGCR